MARNLMLVFFRLALHRIGLGEQFLYSLADVLFLLWAEKLAVDARDLRADHSLAIDERHEGHQWPLVRRPLHVLERPLSLGRSHGKRGLELLNEIMGAGVVVHRAGLHSEPLGSQLLLNATPNLRGPFAGGSS